MKTNFNTSIIYRLRSPFGIIPHLLTGFRSQGPTAVDIELSNRCNLRCRMCWFHGESGIGDKYRGQELTTHEVFKLVDRLSTYKPRIYVGGSEPFIRDDFLDIIEHIKNHNLAVSFTTNGALLDTAKIKKMVAFGVDAVNFSIDGPEKLHDQLRGAGVFRKATSAVRELWECKKSQAKIKPIVNMNVTLSLSISGHVEKTINALIEATNDCADFYRLHHLWYVTSDELGTHRRLARQVLDCSANGAESHLIDTSSMIDAAAIAKELSSVIDKPKIRMFPNLEYTEIVKYYSSDPIRKRCLASFSGALIKPNGDVKFCPDEWIDDYVLGNVRNQSFDNIWNNGKARKFRAELWKRKSFPGCKRCSWMYSFG